MNNNQIKNTVFFLCGLSFLFVINCSNGTNVAGAVDEEKNFLNGGVQGDNGPVADASVCLRRISIEQDGEMLMYSDTASTDSLGRFSFDSVGNGRYVIFSEDSAGMGIASYVEKQGSNYTLDKTIYLNPSIVIKGRVLNAESAEVFIPGTGRGSRLDSTGFYTIDSVPAGEYDLAFISGNTVNYLPVKVLPDGDTVFVRDVEFMETPAQSDTSYSYYTTSLDWSVSVSPVVYPDTAVPEWYQGTDFSGVTYFNTENEVVSVDQGSIPAFPGAEGYGKYTPGGRGGEVFIVTSLEDNGPGTLREAVEASGPRIVAFETSGTIELESSLRIENPYITIAGQTAPGDGICLRNYGVEIAADHVVMRYMRVRPGPESQQAVDGIDGYAGVESKNVIIDHCSVSWGLDEAFSFYNSDSVTIQWCIISESLFDAGHPSDEDGYHGYGGFWGGDNASYHHNLFANHSTKTPDFKPGSPIDFRNNVVYNWGFHSVGSSEDADINLVNNYFKPGPATVSSVRNTFVQEADSASTWYITGNYLDENLAEDNSVILDNWLGVAIDSIAWIKRDTPFDVEPVQTSSAEEAYNTVVTNAGAVKPLRDPVDVRIAEEVTTGIANYEGAGYVSEYDIIDTTLVSGIIDYPSETGGWPELSSTDPPADQDRDGIPDAWEISRGLDPEDSSDALEKNSQGYTWIEVYINSLTD